MNKKILVIDDDEAIRNLLKDSLEINGYDVIDGSNSEEALTKAKTLKPDLIILDVEIPTIGGLEVCRILKKNEDTIAIPIIMLTVRSDEMDKIVGLEIGADDYITKPFHSGELLARVKAVLRRIEYRDSGKKVLSIDKITIDRESHTVTVDGNKVDLRPKEFELLYILMDKKNIVLDRDFLCESVLGYEYFGSTRTIDAHIKNLRKALGEEGNVIKTISGVGYKIEEDEKVKSQKSKVRS